MRKNAFLALKNCRFLFSVHTFPCATSPGVIPNCHAFKSCDVRADYAIFTATHSGLFTRRIQYLGLKPNLSPVLGARSSAIAFPGRPGLTRDRFSPSRVTPSWVPQSSASREQILVSRGRSANSATTRGSLRQRSRTQLLSRSGPVRRLRDSHFREVSCIQLPFRSKLLHLWLGGMDPLSRT